MNIKIDDTVVACIGAISYKLPHFVPETLLNIHIYLLNILPEGVKAEEIIQVILASSLTVLGKDLVVNSVKWFWNKIKSRFQK